jgi:GNAT superfamily N-acetyltransferase
VDLAGAGPAYREALARPGTVLLLATDGPLLVGYGLASVLTEQGRAWLDDTWQTGPWVGEIESLGVLASHRGRGIGTRQGQADRESVRAEVGGSPGRGLAARAVDRGRNGRPRNLKRRLRPCEAVAWQAGFDH